MPPKNKQKVNTKTEAKKKEKIVEDKTFGLKNKKGNKQQKFIKTVSHQVKYGGNPSTRKMEQLKEAERLKKKNPMDELDDLFKPVVQQSKVGKGVDPKSVLCAFFKQGMCGKGAKCKFSHDLAVERKTEKRSLYADERDEDLKNDTMDGWDEIKLQSVIDKKHGEKEMNKIKTEIVCKFFLQAIEERKYGWFWNCPNGGNECKYRHALPPGFILKSDQKKMEEQKEKISLEDLIERERAALGSNVTKITLESFLKWKKRKKLEKVKAFEQSKEKRKNEVKSGKLIGISGREMFEFRPELVDDGEDENGDVMMYTREVDDDEEINKSKIVEVSMEKLSLQAREVDNTGTQASSDRLTNIHAPKPDADTKSADDTNGIGELPTNVKAAEAVPVDEDLFTEDLDDLDELDDL